MCFCVLDRIKRQTPYLICTRTLTTEQQRSVNRSTKAQFNSKICSLNYQSGHFEQEKNFFLFQKKTEEQEKKLTQTQAKIWKF